VAVSPDGKSAYVTVSDDDAVLQYNIDPSTGTLHPKSTASVDAGNTPEAIAITPDADVSVKVSAPASVKGGSGLTYTVTVANLGPSSAWQVVLRDYLPYGTQFTKASTAEGHCTGPKSGAHGGTVTCKLGTIRAGKTAGPQRIQVKITAKAAQGVVTDLATVGSVTPDPVEGNNSATVQTKVGG
jgi:uncharacterized repeat protein (TIGR01451 family)